MKDVADDLDRVCRAATDQGKPVLGLQVIDRDAEEASRPFLLGLVDGLQPVASTHSFVA
jgi:hypothetical protein